jgi:tyrosine-protein phosphatase SIW14
MSRILATLAGVVAVLLCIGGPVAFALHLQFETRNFQVVKEGVLYRSGQTTLFGLKNLIHEYGIRTVVNLRDPAADDEPDPDQAEEDYCIAEEINYIRIPPRHWSSSEGPPPADENVAKFCELMRDPGNYPVLVHCYRGIHRTGAFCAIYHMEFDHWTNAQAVDDLMAHGYYNLKGEEDILGYLSSYRPTWKDKR